MENKSEQLPVQHDQALEIAENVSPLPFARTRRAFELLATQPVSVVGLTAQQRGQVVISAVIDDQGHEHVVSRFGDSLWNLQSECKVQNRKVSEQILRWPEDIPPLLVEDAKAAVYAWFRRGKPGWNKPSVSTLYQAVKNGAPILTHLATLGVTRFDQVRPIHLHDFVAKVQLKKKLARSTLRYRLEVIEVVSAFRGDAQHPLTFEPWSGASLAAFLGDEEDCDTSKTPVIPPSVQEALFEYAEAVVHKAPALLDERDSGEYLPCSTRLTGIRDAALYLIQISTGMRNSETTGIKSGAWRTEVLKGVTFHWIATVEHKTGKGLVEFLAPPEAIETLEILQRWAAPYQARLRAEAKYLEDSLSIVTMHAESNAPQMDLVADTKLHRLQRLEVVRASLDNLFLTASARSGGDGQYGDSIMVMSLQSALMALKRLGRQADVDWLPANHQCRRTFTWTVAQSRLGRRSLVFLKWQLKHSSMSMTQLYAANPRQDEGLYGDLYEEILDSRAEVMSSWFDDDQPLAGGAGKKIREFRGAAVKDRKSLLSHVAQHVNIRGNGHSWCLSEQRGCGGEGIYDASRCVDCSGSVIDQSHVDTWQNIHLQNLELLRIKDCGPGVEQRAIREVAISEKVLQDLGIAPRAVVDAA